MPAMVNLKKSRKAAAFSAALAAVLSCMFVLMGVLSACSAFPIALISPQPAQADKIDDKPYLITWEAVKKLAEGSLSYPDIRDSFYYKEIGSGLYIISFPIEEAPEFFLIASSAGPSAEPMSVGLRCESAELSLELNAENLGIMMELYNNDDIEPLSTKKDDLKREEQDVRALVEAFGKTLRMVSL